MRLTNFRLGMYFLLRGLRLLPLRRRLLRLLLPGVPLIICIFVRESDRIGKGS
jgi:hypothetical protein